MGVRNYALQQFRNTGCVDERLAIANSAGYPDAALVNQVRALFPVFTLRSA